MNCALIKNKKVVNKIIADSYFIALIYDDYDFIVDLSAYPMHPNIGADYNSDTKQFYNPVEIIDEPVDQSQLHLQSGTESAFKVFIIEEEGNKYIVRLSGKYIDIGCIRYNALWLRDAFHKIVREKSPKVGVLTMTDNGVSHGGFYISSANMKLILDKLETVKLC